MRWHLRKKKDEGPFKANRILDTPELKVDQVFTRDGEKPVALFTHATEKATKEVDVSGYAGPVGGKAGYKATKEGEMRAFYLADNISQAEAEKNKRELVTAAKTAGSLVPYDIPMEKAITGSAIQLTPRKVLEVGQKGSAQISGSFVVSGSRVDLPRCTHCGELALDSKAEYCSRCGKRLDTLYDNC